MKVRIEASWESVLQPEFDQPYFKELTDFVRAEYAAKTIYPPAPLIFNAFDRCPFHQVKVVIIGQDPYHGPGQAHGLCFSGSDGGAVDVQRRRIQARTRCRGIQNAEPANQRSSRSAGEGREKGTPTRSLHRNCLRDVGCMDSGGQRFRCCTFMGGIGADCVHCLPYSLCSCQRVDDMVKVTAERLKRKYAERKRGQKDAHAYLCDSYRRTESSYYKAKHTSQNPN